jgi:hypothetical protein
MPNDLMLSGKDKDKVSVQAISFSNLPDFVEGQVVCFNLKLHVMLIHSLSVGG